MIVGMGHNYCCITTPTHNLNKTDCRNLLPTLPVELPSCYHSPSGLSLSGSICITEFSSPWVKASSGVLAATFHPAVRCFKLRDCKVHCVNICKKHFSVLEVFRWATSMFEL